MNLKFGLIVPHYYFVSLGPTDGTFDKGWPADQSNPVRQKHLCPGDQLFKSY